jgi:hypothetical protein
MALSDSKVDGASRHSLVQGDAAYICGKWILGHDVEYGSLHDKTIGVLSGKRAGEVTVTITCS